MLSFPKPSPPAPPPPIPSPALHENVNKQAHYARYKFEPLDFIVANNLPYREGNIIKYVCRWPYKGQALSDLYKARDYLQRIINDVERAEAGAPTWLVDSKGVVNPS